ncbi:ABC transporter permease [Arthrobacter sp. P2b]|uniref:ABC transporter permease n=1 Tax=Arthrobacter sp. P2b TaxID=1938741 RepID=UPI0009CCCB3E|nr:ABC transporter permease [Arthrobacter sp. P2b]SLJ96084.1 ABC-type xylose transport system, permease component [Arthrobacter sp. P2b]
MAGATPTELVSLFGSPALFLLIFLVFAFWLGDTFYNSDQRMLEFSQALPALVITLGVVICLSVGQFDLSVAYNASLCAYLVIGLNYRNDVPMWASILITLGIASLIGFINGILITKLRINAFITTLGTGGVLLGLAKAYSNGGQGINPTPTDHPLPDWFRDYLGNFQNTAPVPVVIALVLILTVALLFTINGRAIPGTVSKPVRFGILAAVAVVALLAFAGSGLAAKVSVNVVIFLLLAVVLWIVMSYTTFGRNLYAVGSNPRAAGYAGVSVTRQTISAFVLAGLLAGLAGVILAATQGSAIQGAADGYLLPAYSGAFLSTVLISRGRFHIWGAVLGALCLTYVASGLVVGGVPYTWADVFNGAVLIAAVALSSVVRRASR